MGRVSESLIDDYRDREEPDGPGYGRLDTTGFRPIKKDPDEIWRERGYYPDGEKYDYSDDDEVPAFDPEAARRNREAEIEKAKHN